MTFLFFLVLAARHYLGNRCFRIKACLITAQNIDDDSFTGKSTCNILNFHSQFYVFLINNYIFIFSVFLFKTLTKHDLCNKTYS